MREIKVKIHERIFAHVLADFLYVDDLATCIQWPGGG